MISITVKFFSWIFVAQENNNNVFFMIHISTFSKKEAQELSFSSI